MNDDIVMVNGIFGKIPLKFEPIEENSDHMTLQDWKECCEEYCFIDDDGWGDFATETECSNMKVSPSEYWNGNSDSVNSDWNPPQWATHIVWYNR